MSVKCEGHHRHVQLMGGRASAARVYPDELCEAVVQGLKRRLTVDGKLSDKNSLRQLMEDDIFDLDEHQDGDLADGDYFLDDLSGRELDPALVRKARAEEIEVLAEHEVYSKVPISECLRVTGKNPIGSRWVDINKGDTACPEY